MNALRHCLDLLGRFVPANSKRGILPHVHKCTSPANRCDGFSFTDYCLQTTSQNYTLQKPTIFCGFADTSILLTWIAYLHQGIYTLIVQSSILFCHTRYGSFFICPPDKQKELPPGSIAGTIRPSNFTYLAKRLCLLDFRPKGYFPLKSLPPFRWDGSSHEKLSRKLCPLRVPLYTTPPNQSNW